MTETLYRLVDGTGALLYVGISNGVPRRLNQHLRNKPWFSEVETIHFEHFGDRDEVEQRERVVIERERPRYNVVHQAKSPVITVLTPVIVLAPSSKGYMTLKELAALIGIHPDALRMQVHRKRLAAEKMGRDWIVSDDEAARYMRENAGKRGTSSPLHPGTGGRPPKPKASDAS